MCVCASARTRGRRGGGEKRGKGRGRREGQRHTRARTAACSACSRGPGPLPSPQRLHRPPPQPPPAARAANAARRGVRMRSQAGGRAREHGSGDQDFEKILSAAVLLRCHALAVVVEEDLNAAALGHGEERRLRSDVVAGDCHRVSAARAERKRTGEGRRGR